MTGRTSLWVYHEGFHRSLARKTGLRGQDSHGNSSSNRPGVLTEAGMPAGGMGDGTAGARFSCCQGSETYGDGPGTGGRTRGRFRLRGDQARRTGCAVGILRMQPDQGRIFTRTKTARAEGPPSPTSEITASTSVAHRRRRRNRNIADNPNNEDVGSGTGLHRNCEGERAVSLMRVSSMNP